jgi:cytochrome c peroxidase
MLWRGLGLVLAALQGLPPVPWPADNPYSPARVELGRTLFFDQRLSANGKIACASCHQPEHAFSGGAPTSFGVTGKPLGRRTPTLINRAWGKSEMWDGRAPTLEAQIVMPLTDPNEMGITTDQAVRILSSIGGYGPMFAAAFGDNAITFDRMTKALASFERTIVSQNSAYDRFKAGDKSALTKNQKAGLDFSKAKANAPSATAVRTSPMKSLPISGSVLISLIPILGMERSPESAETKASSRHRLYATLPTPVLICTTADSRI